jgi:pyrroline-5-carboxylate reductase
MSGDLKLPDPTWFVGCGNMGGAILEGWRAAGLDLSGISVIRPSGKPIEGVRVITTPVEAAGAPPQMVILAFKPQMLQEIAPRLRPYLGPQVVIVSILAGVEVATLRSHFPEARGIMRAMPNLPVAVRRGVTGLYGDAGDWQFKQQIGDLFVALGFAMWMADEGKLSALGSVAGAGPAYVARFIAALAKAGVRRGLTEEIASTLSLETVLGTAWMAVTKGETMESIASRVASPKGTTQAGLAVLDHGDVLDELVALTIDAASRRGVELAEEARAASIDSPLSLT